ncbi:hypothetical protein SALBM311S_07618 [Streptomyces alboniger]
MSKQEGVAELAEVRVRKKSGMVRASTGTICATRNMISRVVRLKRKRVTAVAARNATSAERMTTSAAHQQAVEEVAAEVLLFEDPAERVERGRERPGAGVGGLDLPGRLEGGEHHPVQREGDRDGDQEGGGLGGQPSGALDAEQRAHATAASRTRRYGTVGRRAHSSSPWRRTRRR